MCTSTSASDVIDAVLGRHGEQLAKVIPACSFLLNGVAVRDRSVEVADGAEFDVLPPVAGDGKARGQSSLDRNVRRAPPPPTRAR
ncbi:MoaD/ThiS family protein [Saccharopolyspora sp. NPDC000995]